MLFGVSGLLLLLLLKLTQTYTLFILVGVAQLAGICNGRALFARLRYLHRQQQLHLLRARQQRERCWRLGGGSRAGGAGAGVVVGDGSVGAGGEAGGGEADPDPALQQELGVALSSTLVDVAAGTTNQVGRLLLSALHCPHCPSLPLSAPHCSLLPLTALHCPSLLLTAPHCPSLPLTARHCPSLPLTAPNCPSLTAPHCPSLLLTAPHSLPLYMFTAFIKPAFCVFYFWLEACSSE